MHYFSVQNKKLLYTSQPPAGLESFFQRTDWLLPPVISNLHRNFQAWGLLGIAPGPVTPDRVWIGAEGALALRFAPFAAPKPLLQIGLAPDLAAWLVLLDKRMETFVVVARARSVWSGQALAAALTFMTPAFLPQALVALPPDNWERVAQAVAIAVTDGPLMGTSQDRHWQAAHPPGSK